VFEPSGSLSPYTSGGRCSDGAIADAVRYNNDMRGSMPSYTCDDAAAAVAQQWSEDQCTKYALSR
jgi:hypothetical protein